MNHLDLSNKFTIATGLKAASIAEAVTLVALVFVAVPLKHLAHMDIATRVMGPIHGAVFLLYIWTLIQAATEGGWRRSEVIRMILVACIPLAGFINQPWLNRKISALREHPASS
jgi:integral membrane protein